MSRLNALNRQTERARNAYQQNGEPGELGDGEATVIGAEMSHRISRQHLVSGAKLLVAPTYR